jgi:hypothetical protein
MLQDQYNIRIDVSGSRVLSIDEQGALQLRPSRLRPPIGEARRSAISSEYSVSSWSAENYPLLLSTFNWARLLSLFLSDDSRSSSEVYIELRNILRMYISLENSLEESQAWFNISCCSPRSLCTTLDLQPHRRRRRTALWRHHTNILIKSGFWGTRLPNSRSLKIVLVRDLLVRIATLMYVCIGIQPLTRTFSIKCLRSQTRRYQSSLLWL